MQLFFPSNLSSFALADNWTDNFSSEHFELVLHLPPDNMVVEEESVESEHLSKVMEHGQVRVVLDTLVFSLLERFCRHDSDYLGRTSVGWSNDFAKDSVRETIHSLSISSRLR